MQGRRVAAPSDDLDRRAGTAHGRLRPVPGLLPAGLCLLLVLTAAGCRREQAAAPSPADAGGATSPASPEVALDQLTQRFATDLPQHLQAWLDMTTPFAGVVEQQLQQAPRRELQERRTLRLAYVERGDQPRFTSVVGLAPPAEALRTVIAAAGEHGLRPEELWVETRQQEALAQLQAAQQALAALPPVPPPERAALGAALAAVDRPAGDPQVPAQVLAYLAAAGSPQPALQQALQPRAAAYAGLATARARLELLVADAFLRYARLMWAGNVRRELTEQERQREAILRGGKERPDSDAEPGDREAAKDAEDLPEGGTPKALPPLRKAEDFVREKLLALLLQATDGPATTRLLHGLVPTHPQYAGLQRELARYRAIAAAGGWTRVKGRRGTKLGPGMGKGLITALEERLAREGYLAGPADGLFDPLLRQAVRDYQQTHQLAEEEELGRLFWDSLAVPVAERIARIELTLQRWRESAIGDDATYVFVNIADFAAEVWTAGQSIFRTKVIVGNRDLRCDEKTKQLVLGYATPIQSARVTYLVIAPTWKVPPKIKREELDVEREKDPNYYQKQGFEILNPGSPAEAVRQLPGPENSLGFVKFIFPNSHAVFMHDTPAKNLFVYPIRAFSHGCMRLEDPLGMARTLLTLDGQWNEQVFTELYQKWQEIDFSPLRATYDEALYEELRKQAAALERGISLKRPIPIHIEYYTVRIDERGRAQFLADPYGYDQQRLHPTPPKECTPDSEKAVAAFASVPEELARLERSIEELGEEAGRLVAQVARLDPQAKGTARSQALAKSLEEKILQARTLAGQVRALHGSLAAPEEPPGEAWDRRRTASAMKLKRMMDELQRLERGVPKRLETLRGRLTSEPAP